MVANLAPVGRVGRGARDPPRRDLPRTAELLARRPAPATRCACASSPSATRRRTSAWCSRRWRATRKEPTGSMGNDLALAMFSEQAPTLFSYFKQRFAQVTNPAIDSVREHIVMSLRTGLGPESNLLFHGARPATQLVLERPVLKNDEMALVRDLNWGGLETRVLDMTFAIARRRPRHGGRARPAVRGRLAGDPRRRVDPRPLRPRGERGARGDPVAPRHLGRPPAPRPHRRPRPRRPCRRDRRGARGPPRRGADRLRRVGRQPLPHARHRRDLAERGERPDIDPDDGRASGS